jgi:hypothetical protein
LLEHWSQIPAVPTSAFKYLDLSSLPADERTVVFLSSGTTLQRPSRHSHSAASLQIYDASLLPWFWRHLLPDCSAVVSKNGEKPRVNDSRRRWLALTPPPDQAPHSSLVYMLEAIRQAAGWAETAFLGKLDKAGGWDLDLEAAVAVLEGAADAEQPSIVLGTAFSYVHLLDHLVGRSLRFELPPGSRALETGGYKGRSRELSKWALHSLITARLGIPPTQIVREYGMSELSSQAYDHVCDAWRVGSNEPRGGQDPVVTRRFRFPPWARAEIISPETGLEVAEGETGLIRVFDLANVYSVMAIQTEDLGIRRGDGFELIGRAVAAESRGCSLMAT